VASADPALTPAALWTFRLSRERPWRLALLGAGVGIAFFLTWLAALAIQSPAGASRWNAIPFWGPESWWEATLRAVLLGYTLVLPAAGLRHAAYQVAALAPVLPPRPGAVEEALARTLAVGRGALRAAGALVTFVLLPLGVLSDPRALGSFPAGGMVWLSFFGWLIGRALYTHLHVARAFSALGARELRIDLFDLAPLAPIARWGLRVTLLWAIWFSLMALFWVGPGPAAWLNALGLVPLLVIALAALVVPMRGVRGRIRAVKRQELERSERELRIERERLFAPEGSGESPRLANLAAYRALVADVREWPLDVSTLSRFALYVALGVGSWVGAALVERLVSLALAR